MIGGIQIKDQKKQTLVTEGKVVVGTIGRLLECVQREYLDLSKLDTFLIDEADKFTQSNADESSWSNINKLTQNLPKSCFMAAFSATYKPQQLKGLKKIFGDFQFLETASEENQNVEVIDVGFKEEGSV